MGRLIRHSGAPGIFPVAGGAWGRGVTFGGNFAGGDFPCSGAVASRSVVCVLWESPEAHRASLELDSVQAAITEAMPLLSGEMGGHQFTVLGSPLR